MSNKITPSIPIRGLTNKCVFCGYVKRSLTAPKELVFKIYTFIFARPSMQIFNNALLALTLRGRGYNNCCDAKSTGEQIFLNLFSKHNPLLCVDIGASRGHYSRILLELTNSKVIAFEPLPKSFKVLTSLQLTFPDRLTTINKGVGDKNAYLDLHFGEEDDSELASFSNEINEIEYVGTRNKNTMRVEVVTLDDFFKNISDMNYSEIDLLKIDTEGYEYEVLLGATNTIKNKRPKFIQIEYNWHQLFTAHSLFKLASLLPNYIVYQLLPYGSGLSKVDIKRPETNIYRYSNFVFVRNDISL